ncbi:hypothetical protein LIER_21445 [Lithospermum erythrorhizon]|uniref:Aminotransferase-like plant mobile domain-containing protein n=1 Tax=Lithospermum erythrorhizon TaxID=34254 RepID=A0AAV3QUE2_LITER
MLANPSLTKDVEGSLCIYDSSYEFLKAFCENWCPCTSTLVIPQGELSMSLWDLLELRVASLNVCPRKSSVVEQCPWDSANRHPFDVLRVGVDLEEEVYCAAFLSCWLCVFVLPAEPLDLICASVFKMAIFMANGLKVNLEALVLTCIYRILSQISLFDNPSAALECFPTHYVFCWMGSYLHDQHTTTNKQAGSQMMRYHGKGKGKVYASIEARSILHSCLVTWKATRTDRKQLFFYDDKWKLTIPTREMVDLAMGLQFWRSRVLSRARKTVTFSSNTIPNSPPTSYKTWLNKLFPSEAPRSSFMKYGKGKGLPAGVSRVVLRRIGIQNMAEALGRTLIRPVVEVSSSASDQQYTKLVDSGESLECHY